MSDKPNKISRFFQELKRRHVFKVVAMYAAAAFIILDVLDVATLMLRLPEWTQKFVVVLLAIGFLLTAILSWFYDFTSEGLKLTKTLDVSLEENPEPTPSKRGFRFSDVIIGVLVLVVCILAYPRIFRNKANLKVMTTSLTYKNEFGDKESKRIFKDEFIERLALTGFSNESEEPAGYEYQFGFVDGIREDLVQFNYLILGQDWRYNIQLNQKIDWAKENNYPHFLTGSFDVSDEILKVTSRLYQTSDGSLKSERTFSSTDFMALIDSISLFVRIDLGISPVILNSVPDSPARELITDNMEAWHYAYYDPKKSFDLDSSYALNMWYWTQMLHRSSTSDLTARKYASQAIRHRHRLADIRDLQMRTVYYRIIGEEDMAIELARVQHEMQPSNVQYLLDLIDLYNQSFHMEEMGKAVQKLIKMVPDSPEYELMLVRSYLYTGKLDKGLKLLKKILERDPDNSIAIMRTGEFYLHKNDLKSAKKNFEKAILMSPEMKSVWSPMLDHLTYLEENPDYSTHLKSIAGIYRLEGIKGMVNSEMMVNTRIHNRHFNNKSMNMVFDYIYPTSDSTVCDYLSQSTSRFIRNQQGEVMKKISSQNGGTFHMWKEDSLVLQAMEYLQDGYYDESLESFRTAYNQSPTQFYLANYIDHLELIRSEEYAGSNSTYDEALGSYGDFGIEVYKKNSRYYYETYQGLIYELLPMSGHRFMVPSFLNMYIQIVLEDELISGVKFVYRDGEEEFLARKG